MAGGECPTYPDTPCRVNLDLMPDGTALWMYALTAVGLLVFAYGFWRMAHVWRMGRAWKPGDWRTGLKRLVAGVASHRKFMQDKRPGTMHAWIFFGFLVLFIGTTIVAIDADLFELVLDAKLLAGGKYLFFELALDAFGVLFVLGVLYAMWRRYVERPPQLHPTDMVEQPAALRRTRLGGDLYALLFLLGIGVTGFLLEALRLAHQVSTDHITYARWSFVGNILSGPFQSWRPGRIEALYRVLWWTHFALWTSVLAVLPWTKFKHIVTSSLNLFFHDPARQSRSALPTPFKLQEVMASGAADIPVVGVKTIRDFTWKDRLSLDACTNCGRCEAQCPATAAGRPLSPRKLIQDLKAEMWCDAGAGKGESRPLIQADGVDAALQEATLWSCTTCRACVTACPVDIEHVDLIVEMRRGLVMESRLDGNKQRLLVNLTNTGNPYGFPASDRDAWRNRLPPGVAAPTVAEKATRGEPYEWLWWVGCSGSYDPRNQQVTVAIATLLNAAGVDFAILGNEERCNGDPARRLGEEGRFQQSVMENLETLGRHGVQKIIAQCPHCFNTLANEYPDFGGRFEVVHHTVLLERLLAEGRLPLKAGREVKVTYHDSCYLMRHNGIGDAPRAVLRKANGLPVLEMAQNRKEGLCCGAGGANMWFEVKDEKERINVIRAKQAAATGAGTVATACPFCLTMMTDGLNLTGQEGKMEARDLAEIVADHLDWTPSAAGGRPTAATGPAASGGWSG
ncbi:MAG TPA: (Fe-S)-binding protein [Candidatus Thermoplasmatota archaeon]|nr:(Fe-S)-binding protein [Candidatus Thermoplasmatota archaeon]